VVQHSKGAHALTRSVLTRSVPHRVTIRAFEKYLEQKYCHFESYFLPRVAFWTTKVDIRKWRRFGAFCSLVINRYFGLSQEAFEAKMLHPLALAEVLRRSIPPTPYILHPTSCTLHPTPYALHRTPYTLRPKPNTLHPKPYTLHPTSYTLHPTPYTLHPTPYTQHPTPCTLHPTPYTQHPTPNTLYPKKAGTCHSCCADREKNRSRDSQRQSQSQRY
jgi:hypothetical protein